MNIIQRALLEQDIRRSSNNLVESLSNAQLDPTKDEAARQHIKAALASLALAQVELKVR